MAFVIGLDTTRQGAKMMLQRADTPTLDNHGSPRGAVPTRVDHDSSLVVALRRGEPSAADNLVAAYGNRAFRLPTRITGSPADAQAVVEELRYQEIAAALGLSVPSARTRSDRTPSGVCPRTCTEGPGAVHRGGTVKKGDAP